MDEPVRATYEIADYAEAMRMLTTTTLRNLIGSMDLERARASRVELGSQLTRGLREHTGAWGITALRAEIRVIEVGSRSGCD